MELICKIQVSSRMLCSVEGWRYFWGSAIVASEDEDLTGGPPKVFLRSLVASEIDNEDIIQRYASVESLEIEFKNKYKVLLYSKESLYKINISHVPSARLKAFTNYLQELLSQDSSKLKLPSVSHVSTSVFQLPLSLINVNGDDEYSTKVELEKEDLEHVISLKIEDCSLTTPIGSGKMKNLRSLWLGRSVIGNNDIFQVKSRELKELYVCECELQFEVTSLFQNELNFIDSLSELYLERNQLSQLPDGVFQFRNLLKLSLNDNRLTQLPDTFFNLPKLKELWLFKNQLEYLPCSLLSLQLKFLNVRYNKFVFDTIEPETSSKNIHPLKELTYRTILNNKLLMKDKEKLPKSLRETLANPQQCLCGSKFVEGRAVSFRYNLENISDFLRVEDHNYVTRFPIRGVICNSSLACSSFLYRNVDMKSLLRYLKL